MVSFPDWTRFRGVGEAPKDTLPPGGKYQRQRAEEAMKQAEAHGYFLEASRKLLEERFLEEGKKKKSYFSDGAKEKDLGTVFLVNLRQSHLRSVGDIGLCRNLTVCILNNNYITKFDGLAPCVNLLKLDLHSNQISMLPNAHFWAGMRRLHIVNLHDNPLGRIENLHLLSACRSLVAVTLYDTPLSLKRNYRHHVVNSIWTLRALDHHAISDEEIIEDAHFGGHFAALHQAFRINLCPALPQDTSLTDELQILRDTVSRINQIIAHCSPVLIIQRHIRGFLMRKRFKVVQDIRLCAAVTIQRGFREWNGIDMPPTHFPPPPSPVTGIKALPPTESTNLDYDMYMQNHRPGSVGPSEVGANLSPHTEKTKRQTTDVPNQRPPPPLPAGHTSPIDRAADNKHNSIHIDLAKLHIGTLQSLQDDAPYWNTGLSTEQGTSRDEWAPRLDTRRGKKKRSPREERKKRPFRNTRQFFGPVVDTIPTPDLYEPTFVAPPIEEDQDIPVVDFRLRGRQRTVQLYDPTTDMILARRDAGKEIRMAEDEFHRQTVYVPKPEPKKVPSQSSEQFAFAKIQGSMGLTCLQAIQQAYKDREKAEKRVAKLETVLQMKEQRDAAKGRVKLYQEEKRSKVLREKERDHRSIMDQIDKIENQHQETLEKYVQIRKRSSNHQKQQRGELTFIRDFNIQNTSVSNALLRHDRQARQEDRQVDRDERLKEQRSIDREQQEVVRNYMEHRQLMRQTESAMSKAAVDTKMLQEANDRLISAKSRVAHLKSLNNNVQTFYPLPVTTRQTLPNLPEPRAASVSLKNFQKWNANKLNRHHTVATMS